MARPTAYAVAMKAIERLQGPEIAYSKEKCDGFIKECIRQCGGKLDASGTNNIFRNHCSLTADFTWRKPAGLEIGDMLFIREEVSGDTPAQYRNDGIGDVNHIGIFVGPIPGYAPEYCVIHSSQSRGKVAASTLQNAWNRRGQLECLNHASSQAQEDGGEAPGDAVPSAALGRKSAEPGPGQAKVVTRDRKGLNLREGPDAKAEGIKTMPDDTIVEVLRFQTGADGRPWVRVRWDISATLWHEGWCCGDYLAFGNDDS